jgi:CrcB protein
MTPSDHPAASRTSRTVTLLLVAGGGAVGASIRFLVERGVIHAGGAPIVWLLTVNLVGAFVLGVAFGRLDPRRLRLVDVDLPLTELPGARGAHPMIAAFVSTGFCGALTTYSSLAEVVVELWSAGERLQPCMLLGLSLALGPAAIIAGVRLGKAGGSRP